VLRVNAQPMATTSRSTAGARSLSALHDSKIAPVKRPKAVDAASVSDPEGRMPSEDTGSLVRRSAEFLSSLNTRGCPETAREAVRKEE